MAKYFIRSTHAPADCPSYMGDDNPIKMQAIEWLGRRDALAGDLGVKVVSSVLDPPAHEEFLVVEAEDMAGLSKFLLSNPVVCNHETRAVTTY
jgi:hypothetical protein